jgi:hypothetical protein
VEHLRWTVFRRREKCTEQELGKGKRGTFLFCFGADFVMTFYLKLRVPEYGWNFLFCFDKNLCFYVARSTVNMFAL